MVAKLGTKDHYKDIMTEQAQKAEEKDKQLQQKDARIAELEAAIVAAGGTVPPEA
jgi:Tfp pilus assembly protein FimV